MSEQRPHQMNAPGIGFDAAAYALRDVGASPDRIRVGMWAVTGETVGGDVLDAGSGGGDWIQYLRRSAGERIRRISAVDIVDSGVGALPGVDFHQADLAHSPLPFANDSFDWIFALEVIEHLANPRHFVAEAARVLRVGGKLALSTPSNDSINARLSLLVRGYSPLFREHAYVNSGHITPVLEIDLRRMALEKGLRAEFFYPCDGHIPRTKIRWPFRGKFFTDALFCVMTKVGV